MTDQKQALRKELLAQRLAMHPKEVQEKSETLLKKLKSSDTVHHATNIALYLPFENEVDLSAFIPWGQASGKTLYLPRYNQKNKTYEMVKLENNPTFQPGKYGILEAPESCLAEKEYHKKIDLYLVPGVAFDKSGNRIGRGMGIFDRLLSSAKGKKIGIAYEFQIVDSLQCEEWDVQMDLILTEGS